MPFRIDELIAKTPEVDALFLKSFRSPAPDQPRHFAAFLTVDSPPVLAGYVHFTPIDDGVFLLGGLCIDASIYRRLSRRARDAVAQEGSLARWLMRQSLARLGRKRAVFGYTGDSRSRRDTLALGFVPEGPRLVVKWYDSEDGRTELVARVAAIGPF